jgi:ABC-type branched-subunit amino acid transport system substrate-binding protein
MTTKGRLTTLVGLLLATAAGCQGSGNPPPIFLGHVANLSGADPSGKHAEQGIRLALVQLTENHLDEALGGRPLQVRHTDARGQLDAFEAQAVRLVGISRVVGLIGGATPDEVARLDAAHVPVLAPAGVRPPGVSDMTFAVGMRPGQQAFILAKHAAEDADLADVLILADERREDFVAAADAFARSFIHARQEQGKKATAMPVRFGKDAKWDELAKLIVERKSLGAVFFAGKARDWIELRRARDLPIPLLFAGEDGDAAGLQDGGHETIYLATAFAPDKGAPRAEAFIRKYQEGFKEPPDVAAALGYESLQLFAEALKHVGPTITAEKLQAALREVKEYSGLCGTIGITADQFVRRPLYLARYEAAGLVVLRRYEPDALP